MFLTTLEIEGVKKVLKDLNNFGKEAEAKAIAITKIQANDLATDAKLTATKLGVFDNGNLVQGIKPFQLGRMKWKVAALEPYSAFHEFGTGTSVSIPQGWEKMAAQFKGKGKRKINLPARPYLYPAFRKVEKTYLKDLEKALDDLTKKYSS